ncbi:MAG: FtsX-like permease family protein, partial [Natronosporangium sp.]
PLQDVFVVGAGQLATLVSSLMVVGLVLAGPWLCHVVSRGVVRISRRAPGLIAARRIAADPRATFRAVSGVVLAVAAVTYIGSTGWQLQPFGPLDESQIMRLRPGVVQVYTGGVPEAQVAPLVSEQSVTTRQGFDGTSVSCVELARMRYVGCPYPEGSWYVEPGPGTERGPVVDVYLPTDGSLAAENRVRTRAANLVPNAIINTDRDPVDYALETLFVDVDRLVSVAGGFVLLIGACSLTAGMVGGLIERRRPFALLRASGMRLGELRRVVLLETTATMVVTSALGVGIGLLGGYAAARQGEAVWSWPDLQVFAVAGSGVLAALGFSALALPLLDLATRHDTVRFE